MARMRPRFRLCYDQGLRSDPTTSGKLVYAVRVAPNGEVSNVELVSNVGLTDTIAQCIRRQLRNPQFDPPGGSGSTLHVPLVLHQTGERQPSASPPPSRPFGVGSVSGALAAPEPEAVTRPSDEAWRSAGEAELAKLRAASAATPESRTKQDALLRGLLARGRFEEALTAARVFVEADPDFPAALDLLSYAAIASGDRETALRAVDAVVETSALSLKAHIRAARGFEAAGDERRACAHWRSLAELDDQDEWRYQALRCRARTLGDREAAAVDAREAVAGRTRARQIDPSP
jgi:Ca-activated chloride channel family protein